MPCRKGVSGDLYNGRVPAYPGNWPGEHRAAYATAVRAKPVSARSSHPASASSSARTVAVMLRVKGTSGCTACTVSSPGLAIGRGVDLTYEPAVVQDRQREVTPAPEVALTRRWSGNRAADPAGEIRPER